MIKTLVKHGNSHALIIDRTMMEMLGIEPDSPLNVVVRDGSILVMPSEGEVGQEAFEEAKAHILSKYDGMLKRLAE